MAPHLKGLLPCELITVSVVAVNFTTVNWRESPTICPKGTTLRHSELFPGSLRRAGAPGGSASWEVQEIENGEPSMLEWSVATSVLVLPAMLATCSHAARAPLSPQPSFSFSSGLAFRRPRGPFGT